MIIGCCRVSSREQQINSEALAQQIARVRPHCDRLIVEVQSGASRSRPKFKELESLIRSGEAKKIVCTRLDRLTRSLRQLQNFLDLVERYGVEVQCLDDDFDLTTATGRFHANIVGSVAEMESAMLSERVRHGWAYFRKQGKIHSPAFGYRVTAENKLEIDHDPFVCLIKGKQVLSRYQIARMLVDWYINPPEDGNGRKRRSLRRTIELLNEKFGIQVLTAHKGRNAHGQLRFSPAGLRDWLSNPALRGHTAYLKKRNGQRLPPSQWLVERDTHEPLITQSEAERIALILEGNKNQNFSGKSAQRFPASGLVRCLRCRGTCYTQSGNRGKTPGYNYYYQCSRWTTKACDQNRMIRIEKVESAIIEALVSEAEVIARGYEISQEDNPVTPPEVVELQQSLEALEKLPYNPAIEQSKAALKGQLEETLQRLYHSNVDRGQRALKLSALSDHQRWGSLGAEEKMQLFRYFVKAAWLDNGEIVRVDLH